MPRTRAEQMFTKRIITLLIIGSLTAFLGATVAGKAQITLGVSQTDFIVMIFASFLLFLITGISWMYTAILIKEREER